MAGRHMTKEDVDDGEMVHSSKRSVLVIGSDTRNRGCDY